MGKSSINGAFSIARFDYQREVTIWIPGCWKNLAWVLLYSSLWPVMREELRKCSSFAGYLSLLRDHWPYKDCPVFGWLHPHKLFFSQLSEDFPKKCPLKNHFSCLKKAPGWPCHVMVAASEVRTSSGDLLSWERKGSKVAWLVLQWWTTLPPVECGYHRDIILVYLMGYFFGDIGYCTLYPTGICVKRYNGHTVLLPGMWELWCWFDANPVLNQPRFNEMGAFQTLLRCFFLLCRWTLLFYFHDIPFEAELGPHIPDVISWQVCIRDCKTIFPIFLDPNQT